MKRRTFCAILPAAGALWPIDAATQPTSPRERLLLDSDWQFLLGDPKGADAASFDASTWRTLDLPHDWSIEGHIDPMSPMRGSGGYFPAGIGWYRRTLNMPPQWANKRVIVEFEGVYMNATVYINGQELGTHPYGYTTFFHDLTPHLRPGPNLLAVRVDQSKHLNSRWYSGSGIYRHVWLDVAEALHVAPWGVSVTTPSVSAAQAKVAIQTRIINESQDPSKFLLRTSIESDSGTIVGQSTARVDLKPQDSIRTNQEVSIPKPKLWSPTSPSLYRAVTRVIRDGKIVDELVTPFGIRSIEWSADKGFLLNGTSLKMAGGCVHHDNGPLGAAAFDRAEERKVQLLKDAGFNAVRASHNPPSRAFLDACDRLGMLVIDEAFDSWSRGKNPQDYSVYFKDWWQRDIDALVLRDRNHPSVVAWSIGNEIGERGEPLGAQEAKMIADYVRTLDRTRPITSALNFVARWPDTDDYYSALDIAGYNYNLNNHVADHKRVPARVMACTESYPRSTFDDWAMVNDSPYIVGNFVWTAIDYLGESGLGRSTFRDPKDTTREGFGAPYPWHGATCGDMDLCGTPRAIAHYRNIVWDRGEKLYLGVRQPVPDGKVMSVTQWGVWPVFPSWTWPGMEGKELDVEVYSRAAIVRLYQDDKLIDEKPTTRAEQFKATFKLTYTPGVLKAVAIQDGKAVAQSSLRTAAEPAQLRLSADRATLHATGQDLSFVTVEALDSKGQPHPNADHPISFRIQGPGTIAAVGNGDLTREEPYQGTQRKLFHGRALVVIRSSRTKGRVTLTASAQGLRNATLSLETI